MKLDYDVLGDEDPEMPEPLNTVKGGDGGGGLGLKGVIWRYFVSLALIPSVRSLFPSHCRVQLL